MIDQPFAPARPHLLRPGKAVVLVAVSAFLLGCGEDPPTGGTGGSGGSGGSGGRGGSGGSGGSAGTGGSGGSAGSGGSRAPDMRPADTGPRPDAGPRSDGGGGDGGAAASGPCTGDLAPPGNSPLTAGFTQTRFNWRIHSPRNLPASARYTCDKETNTHTTFILADDEPFQAGNNTDPRTEMRWELNYPKGGKHMFDADVFIVEADRTCIMQVFQTRPSPTTFMLTAWKDKTLRYYFGSGNGPLVMSDAWGKWFNLKVLHDTAAGRVTVYIDDKEAMSFGDRGGSNWYFKNGAYGSRSRTETRWRNIRYWVKP